jgi:competence protein ComEC
LVKYDDLESDILKLGHHGSNTSSAEQFIAEVKPEYAIVSSGKDNRYKHPHPAVIERVSKYVKNILNTAEVGTIHFVLEKDKILLK